MIASASGSGKTTLAGEVARRLQVPFVEMDALVHGPNWTEATDEELRAKLASILAGDGWVTDNAYRSKLGDLLLEQADTVVWLDLPLRVWLPRLLRRTFRRIRRREALWNDNRESVRNVVFSADSIVWFSLRNHFARRRRYPVELARFPVVRLRSPREVRDWLERATPPPTRPPAGRARSA